eukprot:gb/GECH01011491.1/.p1 GENE.gb/GECH01011491.1/~~gb/GECH01011491.1/.p1  ORF type:complete len:159 (+),score=16.49 gb/GECH01011491.1/:1-477(+)
MSEKLNKYDKPGKIIDYTYGKPHWEGYKNVDPIVKKPISEVPLSSAPKWFFKHLSPVGWNRFKLAVMGWTNREYHYFKPGESKPFFIRTPNQFYPAAGLVLGLLYSGFALEKYHISAHIKHELDHEFGSDWDSFSPDKKRRIFNERALYHNMDSCSLF